MTALATNAFDAADGWADAVDSIGDRHGIGVEQRVVGLEFGGGEGHGRAPCFQA